MDLQIVQMNRTDITEEQFYVPVTQQSFDTSNLDKAAINPKPQLDLHRRSLTRFQPLKQKKHSHLIQSSQEQQAKNYIPTVTSLNSDMDLSASLNRQSIIKDETHGDISIIHSLAILKPGFGLRKKGPGQSDVRNRKNRNQDLSEVKLKQEQMKSRNSIEFKTGKKQ